MGGSIRPRRVAVTFDCPDAHALAEFYAKLLGWRVHEDAAEPDWADVLPPEGEDHGFALACQQVENYRMPQWPDGDVPQQAHLDLYVDSIAEATELALAAGASKHEVQPGSPNSFVVFTDPAGHPFCLCRA